MCHTLPNRGINVYEDNIRSERTEARSETFALLKSRDARLLTAQRSDFCYLKSFGMLRDVTQKVQ